MDWLHKNYDTAKHRFFRWFTKQLLTKITCQMGGINSRYGSCWLLLVILLTPDASSIYLVLKFQSREDYGTIYWQLRPAQTFRKQIIVKVKVLSFSRNSLFGLIHAIYIPQNDFFCSYYKHGMQHQKLSNLLNYSFWNTLKREAFPMHQVVNNLYQRYPRTQ